jgi:hypothetical protein
MEFIHKEIKKPKRPGTELLELWLERELDLEDPGAYGNLPTDESHITAQLLPNGDYKITMSDTCFKRFKTIYNRNHTAIECPMTLSFITGLTL